MYFGDLAANYNDVDPITLTDLNYKMVKKIVRKAPELAVFPQKGALVTINFCGTVAPNKIVEDVLGFQCQLGDYELVDGLELALYMMKIGEIAEVSMDFAFGYGIFGLQDNTEAYLVPPYSKISYKVELLSIENEILLEIKDNEILRRKVALKKARGDFWLKRLEVCKAIYLYKRALDYLLEMDDDVVAIGRAEGLPLTNAGVEKMAKRSWRAIYQVALNESQVIATLQRDPDNKQALFHLAKILILMNKTRQAYGFMRRVTQLDGENQDAALEALNLHYHELRRRSQRDRTIQRARPIQRAPLIQPNVAKDVEGDIYSIIGIIIALMGFLITCLVVIVYGGK